MLQFQEIELFNYGPYEHLLFQFTPGKHLIIGSNTSNDSASSNGAGKSTIVEAMLWCIYKKSPKGNNPSRDGKGDCKVRLNFIIDKVQYSVERYYERKPDGTTVKLFINLEESTCRNSTTTDKEILKIINVPYDLFSFCIIALQDLPTNFSKMGPTLRKGVVEGLVGFTTWDEMRSLFSSDKKETLLHFNTKDNLFQENREKMIMKNNSLEILEKTGEAKSSEIESQILSLKDDIKKVILVIKGFQDDINKQIGDKKLLDLEDELNTLKSSLTILSSRKEDIDKIVTDKICPTCEQEYPEIKIESAKKELERLIPKISRMNEIDKELSINIKFLRDKNSEISSNEMTERLLKNQLSQLGNKLNSESNVEEIALIKEELSVIVTTVNELKKELDELKVETENLEFIDSLLLPSSDFRTESMRKYLNYINSIIKDFCPLLFESVKITLTVDQRGNGIEIEIERYGKIVSYNSLSGGEKKRLDIIILFSLQRFLVECSGVSSNIAVFDESFESIDRLGINSVLNTIDSLFPAYMSIYVISHNDGFKSSFDSVLKVINNNGISYIE